MGTGHRRLTGAPGSVRFCPRSPTKLPQCLSQQSPSCFSPSETPGTSSLPHEVALRSWLPGAKPAGASSEPRVSRGQRCPQLQPTWATPGPGVQRCTWRADCFPQSWGGYPWLRMAEPGAAQGPGPSRGGKGPVRLYAGTSWPASGEEAREGQSMKTEHSHGGRGACSSLQDGWGAQ